MSCKPSLGQKAEATQPEVFPAGTRPKKNKVWLWSAVNGKKPGILAWVLGNRSAKTFWSLWLVLRGWGCFLYITDGYRVYRCFIDDLDCRPCWNRVPAGKRQCIPHHLVSKLAMTRIEGENSRLRHYLARLHRKTFCYSKSLDMLRYSIRLLLHYLKFGSVPLSC